MFTYFQTKYKFKRFFYTYRKRKISILTIEAIIKK